MRFRTPLILITALCIAIGAGAALFAVTAANTIPASHAGDGTGTVGTYTTSNIDYTLDGFDITAVTFTLSPAAAASVRVQLNGSWYSCTNTAGSVSCTTTSPQATVLDPSTLQIVAAS
jgi:hypothetical protein